MKKFVQTPEFCDLNIGVVVDEGKLKLKLRKIFFKIF